MIKGAITKWIMSPGIPFGLFLVALVAFLVALAGLFAPVRARLQLEAELDDTRFRRQQQEVLFPFYQSLLSRDRLSEWEDLYAGPAVPLEQAQVVEVPSMLADVTSPHGFRIMDRSDYRVRRRQDGSRMLQVELPLQGRYADLGDLLKDLLLQPYVGQITYLRVEELPAGQAVTIGMDLLLEP